VPDQLWEDLVEALLACDVMVDTLQRQDLILDLRPEIKWAARYASNPSVHVMNLVRRCLELPGGIEELAQRVRIAEGDPRKSQRIDECVRRIREARGGS
jgi:hypothetical protein